MSNPIKAVPKETNWRKARIQEFRQVRNGRVRIAGDWYAPKEPCPELEGMALMFMRYRDYEHRAFTSFVYLWGSAHAARCDDDACGHEQPEVKDGKLPWCFWNRVERVGG